MKEIEFYFGLKPTGKGRPRLGRSGVYTPRATKVAESELQVLARIQLPRGFKPLECPVEVQIQFNCAGKGAEESPCLKRPDLDNYLKLVLDAMNGILWKDDALVWKIVAVKVHSYCQSINMRIIY